MTSTTLDDIRSRLWNCLAAAARDDQHPFNAMQAATSGLDGAPNLRTIALRRVSEADNVVAFNTDLRSPKVGELTREPRIALVGTDAGRQVQIRLFGEARIVRDGPARIDAWNGSADHDLVQYRTLLAPGTPLGEPGDAWTACWVAP